VELWNSDLQERINLLVSIVFPVLIYTTKFYLERFPSSLDTYGKKLLNKVKERAEVK
jgi:hypothetical protein